MMNIRNMRHKMVVMMVAGLISFLSPLGSYLFISCSSIDCSVNSLVRTRYQFTSNTGDSLKLMDTLNVVTKRKDGTDTLIFNQGDGISKFHLPISYSHPEDELVFHFDNGSLHMTDTVWIKKDDYPHFESVDCNASFFHTLTSIRHTHNVLDSAVIVNPSVTNDDQTVHVLLYPKVSD